MENVTTIHRVIQRLDTQIKELLLIRDALAAELPQQKQPSKKVEFPSYAEYMRKKQCKK